MNEALKNNHEGIIAAPEKKNNAPVLQQLKKIILAGIASTMVSSCDGNAIGQNIVTQSKSLYKDMGGEMTRAEKFKKAFEQRKTDTENNGQFYKSVELNIDGQTVNVNGNTAQMYMKKDEFIGGTRKEKCYKEVLRASSTPVIGESVTSEGLKDWDCVTKN